VDAGEDAQLVEAAQGAKMKERRAIAAARQTERDSLALALGQKCLDRMGRRARSNVVRGFPWPQLRGPWLRGRPRLRLALHQVPSRPSIIRFEGSPDRSYPSAGAEGVRTTVSTR